MDNKRELRCPSCGQLLASEEDLGKAIELGMRKYELLELINLLRKSYELERQAKRQGKRVNELLNKLEDVGWNVLRESVKKKE